MTTLDDKSTTGTFKHKLQFYWLCCQVGIYHSNSCKLPSKEKIQDVHDRFPSTLKDHADQIRGIVFHSYLKNQGTTIDNDKQVMDQLRLFFSDTEPSKLSSIGMKYMDELAEGGFRIIDDEIGTQVEMSIFLINYIDILKKADPEI